MNKKVLGCLLGAAVAMPWELRRRQNPPDRSRGHLEGPCGNSKRLPRIRWPEEEGQDRSRMHSAFPIYLQNI